MKIKLISALALMAVAGAANAAFPPANLTFDGYCDGITGLSSDGYGAVGTHAFDACGGYTNTPMAGPAGKNMAGTVGKSLALTDSSYGQFGVTLVYTVNADKTWVGFAPEYGGVFNAGTWSKGYNAAVKSGGKSSFQK